jgi:ATP phosphoribosyltransferase
MLTIALPKGRIAEETLELFERLFDQPFDFENRKLILEQAGFRFLLVRNQDVPTYVRHGAADLGVCGKDVLIESQANITQLLDLGIGRCKVVLGMKKGRKLDPSRPHIKVGTKMTRITKHYFAQKAMAVEVVKLYGSIELAPLVSLCDAVVDIVETGTTMKENGLEPVETILESTARLFANPNSYIEHKAAILDLRDRLESSLG